MNVGRLHFALALLLCVGCGKAATCPDAPGCLLQAEGDDAGPLVSCLPGGWRTSGTGGSCAPIPCRPDGGPPECGKTDCQKHAYTLFVPDTSSGSVGTMFTGSFIASESGGTWSSTTLPERFAYSAEGTQLFTDAGSGPRSQEVSCTAQQLVLGQISLKVRSSPAESAALQSLVLDGGLWSGQPRP